jgi:DNA helicase-2/ATP-dependent DNA helicase PcrA
MEQEYSADKILEGLNNAQKQAVIHDKGPLMLVAGAGTGKTKAITHRIAYLVLSGKATMEEILAVTFTEKATQEMDERLTDLLPLGMYERYIMTFHGLARLILEESAFDIGLASNFIQLDSLQAKLLVQKNATKFKFDYFPSKNSVENLVTELSYHYQKCKELMITPEMYAEYVSNLETKEGVLDEDVQKYRDIAYNYRVYRDLLLENNALDYSDLLFYAKEALATKKNIRQKFQQKFKYVLVDEFQDTNGIQYEIIKLLLGEDKNICVIGDDDQSIYAFRGSSIHNIMTFKDDFPEAKEIFFTQNYRSFQEILDVSYKVVQNNNPNRLEIKLNQGRDLKYRLSKKLEAFKGQGGEVSLFEVATKDQELELLAKNIKHKQSQGRGLGDMAVLTRTGAYAEETLAYLKKKGIQAYYADSSGLYSKEVVIDVLAFIDLLDNYHENPALFRVLGGKMYEVPIFDLIEINKQARQTGKSLYRVLSGVNEQNREELGISLEGLTKITRAMKDLHRISAQVLHIKPVDLVKDILECTGYYQYLFGEDSEEMLEIQSVVNQFLGRVSKFSFINKLATILDFGKEVKREIESGDLGTFEEELDIIRRDAVTIMSVHRSKGLEFEVIFLPFLIQGVFPTVHRKDKITMPIEFVQAKDSEVVDPREANTQEERRLFYVAMTRAREELVMSYYANSKSKANKPSRFLEETGLRTNIVDVEMKYESSKEGQNDKISPQYWSGEQKVEMLRSRLPKIFSVSQVNTFKRCPLRYKLSSLYKVSGESSPSLSFGNSIHKAMEIFFKQGMDMRVANPELVNFSLPKETLIDIYEKNWIEEGYKTEEQMRKYFEDGRAMLGSFYDGHQGEFVVPMYLEKKILYKLGEYQFQIVIDRVDKLADGSVAILDYKTGKPPELNKNGSLKLDNKRQLLLYAFVWENITGIPVSKLGYYYFESGQWLEFVPQPKELEKVSSEILKNLDVIHQSDFGPTPNKSDCRMCQFKRYCPFKKL